MLPLQGNQLSSSPDEPSSTPTAVDTQSIPPSQTVAANRELVESYIDAVQKKILHNAPSVIKVPPESQMGQWLELYRAHLEHPVVKGWMREQGIPMDAISITPSTGVLTVGEGEHKKTFTLTDNSGWGQIAGPLLAAGKIISPVAGQRFRVELGDGYVKVRPRVVADFHGVTLPSSRSEASAQIKRLEHNNKAFDPIPPNDPLRQASSRSAQALQTQKQSAAQFYLTAPQALAYKELAVDVANKLPNTRAEAKKWAESLILKLTDKQVDADTLYLNRFNGGGHNPYSVETSTITGWEYTNQEPSSSLRLPDALLKNFSENDWDPGELDSLSGIYTDGPGQSTKKGYGAHNQFPLLPSALMHESWKTDFQGEMTKKIDDFWHNNTEGYQTAIKGEFAYQARKQLKTAEARPPAERALQAPEHRFTREDYRLVMGAASNLPLDENAPLNVEQLKAQAPVNGGVQVHALNIAGIASNDILRFSAADGGRQVLYVPGAQPAFLRFDSLEKLNEWVVEQTKDTKKRATLASHFPLITRQDHIPGTVHTVVKALIPILWFTDIDTSKDGLDTIFDKMASGKHSGPVIHASESQIEGDAFSAMASASKHRMTSDADVVIKSNSEVTRDIWLNDITVAAGLLAKLAPIAAPVAAAAAATGLAELVLGVEKHASGDTLAERNDGASKAFDGLLNTLFSATASGTPEDPFAIPPEKELPAVEPSPQPEAPVNEEPKPGPSSGAVTDKPTAPAPMPRSPSLIPMAQYAVADGEELIKNATRDASGVYRMTDSNGVFRQLVRLTDETGTSKLYEISGSYRSGNAFAKVIDPNTGKGVMVITPGRNGEWTRAPGDGGAFWNRASPPTPDVEPTRPRQLSDEFLDVDGKKMKGAEILDKYLKPDGYDYTYGVTLNEEGEIAPQVSWTFEENPAHATPPPPANVSTFGTSEYSSQFIDDLHRDKFTIEGPGNTKLELDLGSQITELQQKKGALLSNEELLQLKQKNIEEIEKIIPEPELRARISELANQWALGPAAGEFATPRFKGTVLGSGRNTHYYIKYDPADAVTTVTAKLDFIPSKLSEDRLELEPLTDIKVNASRTFTIRESNELDGAGYTVDPSSPTRMEIKPTPDE
ncbi:hypothetical protein NUV89_16820 [Pseudomonas sp. 18.1.10]|nr:hypothetical protein [Pseudomonas sp. 18.1.10]